MGTKARKARKRQGIRFVKTLKKPTRPYSPRPQGLGLVSGAELLTGLVIRGRI